MRLAIFAIAVNLSVATVAAQGVSTTPSTTWVTDGVVTSAVARDSTVYLGGSFGRIGPLTGSLVAVNPTTGEPDLTRPQVRGGSTLAVRRDGSGGYIIAGTFTRVGAVHARGLARLTADGSVDPVFAPTGLDYAIDALVVGTRLFAIVRTVGSTESSLIALDPVTGQRLSWPTVAVGSGSLVAGPNGTLLVQTGGTLIAYNLSNGEERWRTSADLNAVSAESIFISRLMSVYRVDVATGAATVLAFGTQRGPYCGRSDCTLWSMFAHQGRLYLTGPFAFLAGEAIYADAAAVDATTGALLAWRLPLDSGNSIPQMVGADGGQVFLSYSFPPKLVSVDAVTAASSGWHADLLGGAARALLSEAGYLLVAGDFVGAGGVERPGLAAVRWPDGAPTDWVPHMPPTPTRLTSAVVALKDDRLFVGTSDGVMEIDTVTGGQLWSARTWPGGVRTMVVAGDRLFVGGLFERVDGRARTHLVSFDIAAAPPLLEEWAPQIDGILLSASINSVGVTPSGVFFSGQFTGIAGQARAGTGAVDAVTAAPLSWTLPASNLWFQTSRDRMWVSGGPHAWGSPPAGGQAAFDLSGTLLPWRAASAPAALVAGAVAARQPVDQRALVFADRMYVFLGYALDVATGALIDWAADVDENSTFGSAWTAAGDLGLVRYYADKTGFAFYPRLVDPPGAVTQIAGSATGNTLRLDWSEVAGATSYVVEVGSMSGFANLASLDTQSTSRTLTASAASGTYYVRVRARGPSGLGPASNELRVVLGADACAGPPSAPRSLAATRDGRLVTLTWLPPQVGPFQRYRLRVGLATRVTALSYSTGLSSDLSVIAPAGTYYVRVVAENACGASATSNEVIVSVPASP